MQQEIKNIIQIQKCKGIYTDLINSLQIPLNERNSDNTQLIVQFIQQNSFIQDFITYENDITKQKIYLQIAHHVKYQYASYKNTLIHHGEGPSKFYIILDGCVDVYSPKEKQDIDKDFNNMEAIIEQVNEDFIPKLREFKEKCQFPPDVQMPQLYQKYSNDENFNELMTMICEEMNMNQKYDQNLKKQGYYMIKYCKFKKLKKLESGQIFGEHSLIINEPQNNTIIPSRDSHILYLEKQDFLNIFKEQIEQSQFIIYYLMERFPDINKKEVISFGFEWSLKIFQSFDIVYKSGEIAQYVYLIREGEIQFKSQQQRSKSNDTLQQQKQIQIQKQNCLGKLSSGNFFGDTKEDDLNQIRQQTAQSTQISYLYMVPIQIFKKFVNQNKKLKQIKKLCRDNQKHFIWLDERNEQNVKIQKKQKKPQKKKLIYEDYSQNLLNKIDQNQQIDLINKQKSYFNYKKNKLSLYDPKTFITDVSGKIRQQIDLIKSRKSVKNNDKFVIKEIELNKFQINTINKKNQKILRSLSYKKIQNDEFEMMCDIPEHVQRILDNQVKKINIKKFDNFLPQQSNLKNFQNQLISKYKKQNEDCDKNDEKNELIRVQSAQYLRQNQLDSNVIKNITPQKIRQNYTMDKVFDQKTNIKRPQSSIQQTIIQKQRIFSTESKRQQRNVVRPFSSNQLGFMSFQTKLHSR